jgi:multisubunit Na+/H+ antiporter MnhG subunit
VKISIKRVPKEYTSNSASRVFNFIAATFTIIGVILYFVSDETKDFVKDLSPYLLLVSLTVIIYLLIKQGKLEDIIDDKNKDLKTETKTLWKYYSELSKYEKDKTIHTLLEAFVNSNEYVCGIQIYTFKLFSSKIAFPYLQLSKQNKQKHIRTIKLNYLNGYVREQEDLNAIAQSYYAFDKELLNQFSLKARAAFFHKQPNDLTDFLIEKISYLKNKNIDELDDNDALIFALIELGISFIESRYELIFPNFLDDEKIKLLKSKKRTGIANAIINFHQTTGHQWFSFAYKGNGDGKTSRQYISYITESVRGEKLLFLITVLSSEDWDSYEELAEHNKIRDQLENVLKNSGILFEK